MKSIDYKVNILGLKNKKGSISISALKEITDASDENMESDCFKSGDEILQKIPGVRKRAKLAGEFVTEKRSNQEVLRKIWGKWPGDEPIEELLALLDGRHHR